jgi:hypothetical protein
MRRKIIAVLSFLTAVRLFVWDWRVDWDLILPIVIASNLIFFGLRLPY